MKNAKKSSARRVTKSEAGIPLKKICTELKLEPKAARRKLRAAALSFHGNRERWVFSPAQAKQAREILGA